jgi:hypothetical protein
MFNNKLLDWQFDNGISVYMTTAVQRNQFFDKIFEKNLKNKHCVEIGFGTGILSFLSVKHGAKHVTAFEENYERYQLGLHMIKSLGLEHKISLFNARYNASLIPKDCDLIFQEVFDQEFWADGLAFCAAGHDLPMLPGKYICEYYLAELDPAEWKQFVLPRYTRSPAEKNFVSQAVSNIIRQEKNFDFYNENFLLRAGYSVENTDIDIGIDFPGSEIYTQELQKNITDFFNDLPNKKIYQISNINRAIINESQYKSMIKSGKKVASYELDYNARTVRIEDYHGTQIQPLDRSKLFLDLSLASDDIKNKISILLPVTTVAHDDYQLQLTPGIARTHQAGWDLPNSNYVLVDPVSSDTACLNFRQYFDNGTIRFWHD